MILRLIPAFLIVLALAGCGRSTQSIEIPFVASFGELAIHCDGGAADQRLTDLRLYVSGPSLLTADGRAVPIALTPDGTWQRGELALLDLENGNGACENGTREMNTVLRGSVPAGEFRALKFVVGVPFESNHADPLRAEAPLGDAAMHWHWRGGYKFLRAGTRNGDRGFWIHLGSTGCKGTIQNITGCSAPNRVTVEIDDFDWQRDAVQIDLDALTKHSGLADDAVVSCSSGPAEASCRAPFAALGLDAGEQSVFRKLPRP